MSGLFDDPVVKVCARIVAVTITIIVLLVALIFVAGMLVGVYRILTG